MRLLLIKTSSLGDVVHTLPALTEALHELPDLRVDWLVEESFATIAGWHPAVANVIPVAIRRWRKHPLSFYRDAQWQAMRAALKAQPYDVILDAQGLLKSVWLGLLAQGPRSGFDQSSVREKLSSWFYHRHISVAKKQHAVERTRQLFSQALGYPLPTGLGEYGVNRERITARAREADKLLFLHGTTWDSKHYPENYWIALARLAATKNQRVFLPWGNEAEKARAERIAAQSNATVLPKLSIKQVAEEIATAAAVIGVDSGLGHMACALDTPVISLYGPTNPDLTSTYGKHQQALAAKFSCAPCLQKQCSYTQASIERPACFDTLAPEYVWQKLDALRGGTSNIFMADGLR